MNNEQKNSRTVGYQIFNVSRGKYCGPRFWVMNPDDPTDRRLACNFSEKIHQIGPGFTLGTAQGFRKGLRVGYPRSKFELHKVTTTVRKLRS